MMKFLLKFLKSDWIEDLLEGQIYFNPSYLYCMSPDYSSGQFDPYDSHMNIQLKHLCYAPIISGDNPDIKYGKGAVLAEEADVQIQANRVRYIPVSCFRIVDSDEIIDGIFKLDKPVLEKIKQEFPDYDAFVLINSPDDFERQIAEHVPIYAHKVLYGKSPSELSEIDISNNPEKDLEKFCLQMYNKREQYEYQKEYRIILPFECWESGQRIDIGSIRQICMYGKTDQLESGLNCS